MFAITSLYAGLLTLLLLVLSFRVVFARRDNGISLGDGGDMAVMRRIRAHGNFVENAPFGVILLAVVEAQGAPALAVHALGLMLLVGRVLHGTALTRAKPWMFGRMAGMILTYTMLLLAGVGLILHGAF